MNDYVKHLVHVAVVASMGQALYQSTQGPITTGNVAIPAAFSALSALLHFMSDGKDDNDTANHPNDEGDSAGKV